MASLFSMEGRLNRARYFWTTTALTVALLIIAFSVIGASGAGEEATGGIIIILYIGYLVLAAFQVVKRFHDLDRPGSHYWLLLIPLYNLYLGVVLLFKRGTEGDNKYGPDPLRPADTGMGAA